MVRNRQASERVRVTARGRTRQAQILAFIAHYTADHARAPAIREIAAALGIKESTVDYHLGNLEAAGLLQRTRRISRGISLIAPPPDAVTP